MNEVLPGCGRTSFCSCSKMMVDTVSELCYTDYADTMSGTKREVDGDADGEEYAGFHRGASG